MLHSCSHVPLAATNFCTCVDHWNIPSYTRSSLMLFEKPWHLVPTRFEFALEVFQEIQLSEKFPNDYNTTTGRKYWWGWDLKTQAHILYLFSPFLFFVRVFTHDQCKHNQGYELWRVSFSGSYAYFGAGIDMYPTIRLLWKGASNRICYPYDSCSCRMAIS